MPDLRITILLTKVPLISAALSAVVKKLRPTPPTLAFLNDSILEPLATPCLIKSIPEVIKEGLTIDSIVSVVLVVAESMCSFELGAVVPIPTLPVSVFIAMNSCVTASSASLSADNLKSTPFIDRRALLVFALPPLSCKFSSADTVPSNSISAEPVFLM